MDVTGTIKKLFETKQVSDKFSKREFVVETKDGRYPQTVLFQASNDRISQLNGMQLGEEVKVSFDLRGREWKSPSGEVKFFNTLEAWKIERTGNQAAPPAQDDPPW
jgi:hypothetical protein